MFTKERIPNYLHMKRKERSDMNLKKSELIKHPPPSFQEKGKQRRVLNLGMNLQ